MKRALKVSQALNYAHTLHFYNLLIEEFRYSSKRNEWNLYTSLIFLHNIFYFPLSLCISHFHRHLPWGQFGDFRVCRSATSWISTALGAEEERYMIPKFLVRSSGCWVLVHLVQPVQVQYSVDVLRQAILNLNCTRQKLLLSRFPIFLVRTNTAAVQYWCIEAGNQSWVWDRARESYTPTMPAAYCMLLCWKFQLGTVLQYCTLESLTPQKMPTLQTEVNSAYRKIYTA